MCLRPSSAVCLRKTWPQSFTYPRKLRFATCKGSCWKCRHMTKVFRVLLGTFKGANLDKVCLQICVAVWSRHHRTLANPCKGVCWTNLAVAHACTKKRSLHSPVVLFNIFCWIEETAAVQWLHLWSFMQVWLGLSGFVTRDYLHHFQTRLNFILSPASSVEPDNCSKKMSDHVSMPPPPVPVVGGSSTSTIIGSRKYRC